MVNFLKNWLKTIGWCINFTVFLGFLYMAYTGYTYKFPPFDQQITIKSEYHDLYCKKEFAHSKSALFKHNLYIRLYDSPEKLLHHKLMVLDTFPTQQQCKNLLKRLTKSVSIKFSYAERASGLTELVTDSEVIQTYEAAKSSNLQSAKIQFYIGLGIAFLLLPLFVKALYSTLKQRGVKNGEIFKT